VQAAAALEDFCMFEVGEWSRGFLPDIKVE
jgi:hypothetical protein